MIRVHVPTMRCDEVPVPFFLDGLQEISLQSLLWTDITLGVRDYAWWPVDIAPFQLDDMTQQLNGYTYKANDRTKRVTATAVIAPLPADVIAAKAAAAAAAIREKAKADRDAAVAKIAVTTSSGRCFDGDEVSQGRMARAILALETKRQDVTPWVLSDNTTVSVTAVELREALVLAGQMQTDLWVLP